MLHSRYIVVEDYADDTSKVLYNGSSSIEAQKQMGLSIERAEAQCVLLFSHPHVNQARYPAQEKIEIAQRASQAQDVRNAESIRKAKEVEAKRQVAQKLIAEADELEASLDAAGPAAAATSQGAQEQDSKPKNGKKKKSET